MIRSIITWERDQLGNVHVKAVISADDVARLDEDTVARLLMRKPEQTGADVCLLMESVFHRAAPSHTTNKEK